ncbi:hypothetical protein BASA81_000402 [Batrachochytrium salamandrivorans]|nr:hypothetical protein BASA81_000402 [Batrachochytrium salamandrivorans]
MSAQTLTEAFKESPVRTVIKAVASALGFASLLGFLRYLVFVIQYKMAQNRSKLPLPPGPMPLPLLGSLLDVAKKTGPDGNPLVHVALMDISNQHSNKGLIGLYLGAGYTVVVTKPSVAEECFCDHRLENGEMGHGANTTDRAVHQSRGGSHVPSMKLMTRDGKGLAMSTGPYWRKVRGRLVAHITNPKVAEKNAPMIMEEVQSVCWSWKQKILRGEPLDDLTAQLKRESMNMASRLLFSSRYGSQLPEDYKTLKHCVEYFFQNLSSGNPSDMVPLLRVLPNPFLTEMAMMAKKRDEVLERIINTHRTEFMSLRAQGLMTTRSQARDICDLFLFDQVDGYEAVDSKTGTVTHEYLTDDQVTVCLWDIVFASTDTTATTNEWMIYHMINNPEVQRKVHEELDRVVGPDRVPVLEDRENLPYFWAFIKEVMRFRIVSPVMAPHYAVEDMTLHDTDGKEYSIPSGTAIFMHGYAMALDPELWDDDPTVFKVERWFGKREEGLDMYGQVRRNTTEHYKFMPFSIGPRMCPGYSFAKVAQFLQAATIAHSFVFRLSDQGKLDKKHAPLGKLDMTETWGLTIMPQRFGEMGLISAECRKVEKKIKLLSRVQISSDTAILRFDIGANNVLGLPTGKHIKIVLPNPQGMEPGKWNGKEDSERGATITRAYTPLSSDSESMGYVELLVKIYAPKTNARFPDGGKASYYLGNLGLGDEITITGPWGLVEYVGESQFKVGRHQLRKSFVGMMAGGSGITPMLQILVAALEDAKDHTKFSLIYANQTPEDILCREQLDDLARRFPARFRLHYTVDRVPNGGEWKFSTGFIDQKMIEAHMPPKGEDTLILACGPPPMVEFAVKKNLEALGYSKESFAAF